MFTVPKTLSPTFHGVPTIILTQRCSDQLQVLADEAKSNEAGCLIVTSEDDNGDFTLSECIVPRQQCHSATTELTPDGLAEVGMEVLNQDAERGINPSSPEGRFNRLNTWFHSHVNMGVSPSGQDDQQMVDFCQLHGSDYNFWIRGIINKRNDIHCTVYYRCSNVWKAIVGCDVRVDYRPGAGMTQEEVDAFRALIRDRVEDMPSAVVYQPAVYRSGGYNQRVRTRTHGYQRR